MMNMVMLDAIVKQALEEDIGMGDITTELLVPAGLRARGRFIAKQAGVITGLPVAQRVLTVLSPEITFTIFKDDGNAIQVGEVIAEVEGPVTAILSGERVALNFLQRLSGIATSTRKMVDMVRGYSVKIVDTRKTIPGIRMLDKYAVRRGGGYNHRYGLDDCVLIKDNHIRVAGSITEAVTKARALLGHALKIEVEVATMEQLQEALTLGPDMILLDNMSMADIQKAVAVAKGRVILEASGMINESNVVQIAATGVDIISMGCLTHSVKALDISLKLV